MTGVLLLASAHAGSGEEEAVEQAREVLADRLGDVEHVVTSSVDELDAALDRRAGRTLVVAGGDGSLHLVVARLWERDELAGADLGLVPLGTGNDLARALGLPLEPAAAAAVVAEQPARPLDLLADDAGGIVVNAVHVGVGAEAAETAVGLKRWLGPLAYPAGAVVAGLRSRGWRLRVEVDGRTVSDGRSLMVAVGNGSGVGGGTRLLPQALPDDGLLDVVVSKATGPFARVRYGAALTRGTHLSSPYVRSARGRTVTVSGQPVDVNADGDLGDPVRRRTWTVQPGAWRLHRPPTPSPEGLADG